MADKETWNNERVKKCFKELGFSIPDTEEQLIQWNDKFKDYPFQLSGKELDPIDIWNNVGKK